MIRDAHGFILQVPELDGDDTLNFIEIDKVGNY